MTENQLVPVDNFKQKTRGIIYGEDEDLTHQYEVLPDINTDLQVEVSPEMPGNTAELDYDLLTLKMDPSMKHESEEELAKYMRQAVTHLHWAPNQCLPFRTEKFNSRAITTNKSLEEFNPRVHGFEDVETENLDKAVRSIYREAGDSFQTIFGETEIPRLIIDDNLIEETEVETGNGKRTERHNVGFYIDEPNNNIIVNRDIVPELNPDLLDEDFRYMIKRYHDLSLESSVEDRVAPWVERLRPENELSYSHVYFDNLDKGVGKYNHSSGLIRVDESKIKDFNPITGLFENGNSLSGESIKLHELVHDLDFSNNPETVEYSKTKGDTDIRDPRNSVIEAPTTFEEFLLGWEKRNAAIQAFEDPENNADFFEGYPISELDGAGEPGTIQDPYNMGLFTALNIHEAFMNDFGAREGTLMTRDLLYNNSWSLEDMEETLENFMKEKGTLKYLKTK